MNTNFLKECLKFNQDNLNQFYTTFTKYQEHSEKMTENLFNLPLNKELGLSQGKDLLDQWKNLYKEGQDNMKKIIDDSFKNIEKIIQ
ncbi:MAG: hypothetical protein ACQEQS_03055 [Thermodesulfobacteriota bacterium]